MATLFDELQEERKYLDGGEFSEITPGELQQADSKQGGKEYLTAKKLWVSEQKRLSKNISNKERALSQVSSFPWYKELQSITSEQFLNLKATHQADGISWSDIVTARTRIPKPIFSSPDIAGIASGKKTKGQNVFHNGVTGGLSEDESETDDTTSKDEQPGASETTE